MKRSGSAAHTATQRSLEDEIAHLRDLFVVNPPHIFLLVTLTKDDMNPDHRYSDHFLSDLEFNWQSQNRTTQNSKHGQMLRDHRTMGIHIHLLVRPTKKLVRSRRRLFIVAKWTLFLGKGTAL
jgi:Domain of unknown function (DUF3427)